MPDLIVDKWSWEDAQRARAERACGAETPLRWLELLDALSPRGVRRANPRTLFSSAVLLNSHLLPSTLAAAFFGRPYLYLCWGSSHLRGLKRRLLQIVLKRARGVLVNDPRTAAEVADLAGVRTRRIPYLVDTDFFRYSPPETRGPFLFCPSSNDRDGEVLAALAEVGRDVVWLNNRPEDRERYGERHPRLKLVSNLAYADIRAFYARAAAVVLPLIRDIHAAGQTTGLEAIASGAPLVISAGRTADILTPLGDVRVVAAPDATAWLAAIDAAIAKNERWPDRARARAERVRAIHGAEPVMAALRGVVEEAARGRLE